MIKHRDNADDVYIHIQGSKARTRSAELMAAFENQRRGFRGVFSEMMSPIKRGSILCLGARTGAEVAAARDCGYRRAVGIDLHPVGPNLVRADWHFLPFIDASFDTVFSNSLDHCQSLDRLCAEVRRVLTVKGVFYVRASDPPGKTLEHWERKLKLEYLWWDRWQDLRDAICDRGFVQVASWQRGKWGAFVLRPRKDADGGQ